MQTIVESEYWRRLKGVRASELTNEAVCEIPTHWRTTSVDLLD